LVDRGICISAPSIGFASANPPPANGFPLDLFFGDRHDPIAIPFGLLDLTCFIDFANGSLASDSPRRIFTRLDDENPEIPAGGQMGIAIIFMQYIHKKKPYFFKSLEQPLMLQMIVLNEEDEPDAKTTLELYETISDRKKPVPYDDDDSWMYRSRPQFWFTLML
jgi:hypothetical protein